MSAETSAFLAGPWGATIAIAGMALATYLCRIGGAALMTRVSITPRIERGLRALPGSIILATIVPAALDTGSTALVGIAVTILVMLWTRIEVVALLTGLATVSLIRFAGL